MSGTMTAEQVYAVVKPVMEAVPEIVPVIGRGPINVITSEDEWWDDYGTPIQDSVAESLWIAAMVRWLAPHEVVIFHAKDGLFYTWPPDDGPEGPIRPTLRNASVEQALGM